MKNKLLVLLTAIFTLSCYGVNQSIILGPYFNYTNIHFNNPSSLDGYAGGFSLGYELDACYITSKVFFEGTWNASKLVADPCQRSSTNEYYLELELGKEFSWCNACLHPYIGFGWDRFENVQEPQSIALCYQYDIVF